MPTKRTFDLVVIMLLLEKPVKGLFKMVATRHASNDSAVGQIVGGAARIAV